MLLDPREKKGEKVTGGIGRTAWSNEPITFDAFAAAAVLVTTLALDLTPES